MTAIDDCDIFEVSTPELHDVVRLEDRYGRSDLNDSVAARALPGGVAVSATCTRRDVADCCTFRARKTFDAGILRIQKWRDSCSPAFVQAAECGSRSTRKESSNGQCEQSDSGRQPRARRRTALHAGRRAVATLNLATTEIWNDKAGQRQEKTEWHRVVLWGKTAESLNEYLTKGKQIYVEGRLQTRQWDDKDGNKRYTTEIRGDRIVLLGGGGGRRRRSPADRAAPARPERRAHGRAGVAN